MADIDSIYRELEILGIQDVDRRLTSDVVQKYGFFPYSVWRVQNDSNLTALVEDEIAEGTYGADKSLIAKVSSKKKGYVNKLSGKGLSKFNPAVAYRIVKYWSEPGDVVLDSFSNRGVIALIAGHLGRKGRIYEIVPSYHAHVDKLFKKLTKSSGKGLFQTVKYDLKAYLGDARECKYTEDNSVDLWCSSPPFWCLHPDTLIYTDKGVKRIKDIRYMDRVLTHTGEFHVVTKRFIREYHDDIMYIKTWYNNDELLITPNHEMYIYRDGKKQWIKSEDVKTTDYIVYPINRDIVDIDVIDVSKYYYGREVLNDKIYCGSNQYGKTYINRYLPLDEDLCRLFGYFIAEGNSDVNKGYFGFTFNCNENEFIDDVVDLLKRYLGVEPSIVDMRKYGNNCKKVNVNSKGYSILFKSLFYDKDGFKIIPKEFMTLPINKQKELFYGYWLGDGNIGPDNFSMVTNSYSLGEQLYNLMLRFGIVAKKGYNFVDKDVVQYFQDRIVNRKDSTYLAVFGAEQLENFSKIVGYRHPYLDEHAMYGKKQKFVRIDDSSIGIKIKVVEKDNYDNYYSDGCVYNFEVDTDNSYVTNFGCVHNCVEQYESVDGQLSDIETYSEFLKSYYKAMKQIYRVLKPGKFAIFVVNDFRRPRAPGEKSELILFSDDTKRLMKKAGFEMWDIVINFLYSTPSVIGINKCAEMHRTLKSHEYILVFKKPEE